MVDPDSVTELANILIKKDEEISQLKAQVDGLVKGLEDVVMHLEGSVCECGISLHDIDAADSARQALSTLPSTFLEIQKAKDAVIEAAEQIKDLHVGPKFLKLQQALRTLQQAQEKK